MKGLRRKLNSAGILRGSKGSCAPCIAVLSSNGEKRKIEKGKPCLSMGEGLASKGCKRKRYLFIASMSREMSRSDKVGTIYLSLGEMSQSDKVGTIYLSLGEMSRSDREGIINIKNTLSKNTIDSQVHQVFYPLRRRGRKGGCYD